MESHFREYLSDWQSQSYAVGACFEEVPPFYSKWSLLIELVTGVSVSNVGAPIQRYALANTCAMKIQGVLSR